MQLVESNPSYQEFLSHKEVHFMYTKLMHLYSRANVKLTWLKGNNFNIYVSATLLFFFYLFPLNESAFAASTYRQKST